MGTCYTQGPILDVCWHDDGTKAFMASCDKQVKMWDLGSNQTVQVAAHDAPVKVCRWVKASNYEVSCAQYNLTSQCGVT